jgi:iron(III) transport system substrate-binding protein
VTRGKTGKWLALTMLAALLISACASPPTAESGDEEQAGGSEATSESSEGGSEAAAAGSGEGQEKLQAVYDELEGMEGKERTDKLVELAQAEECEVSFYTSTNVDESGPVTDAFSDEYDIDVSLYRAGSETIVQRVIQEADADFAGADVIGNNGPEMTIIDSEGLLLPLETPVTEDIVEFAVFDNWAGFYLNVFVPAWNTDRIKKGEEPKTWEEVLSYGEGLAFEAGDVDWFATLVKWFVDEKGMTEEEAVDLFREGAKGATVVDGHTLMAELLAAGEYDLTTSSYQHRIPQLAKDGAPVAWEPAVEPAIVRPNGMGIHRDVKCPASALLFVEYSMTEAQKTLIEFDRSPANTTVEGGFPEDVETILVDVEALLEESDKWEGLYEEVIRGSGSEVIED